MKDFVPLIVAISSKNDEVPGCCRTTVNLVDDVVAVPSHPLFTLTHRVGLRSSS